MSQLAADVFRSAQFTFIGRTGRDSDLKTFDNGGSKAKNRIAINQGKDQESIWFSVEAWDEAAMVLADVQKGQMIRVTGRVAVERYQKRNGEEATDNVIKASAVEVLPSRGGDRQPAPARGGGRQPAQAWNSSAQESFDGDDIPF
jgi:single-stranded DNA-binding protein